jgi:hypothetical protein
MAKIPVYDAVRIIPRDAGFLNRNSGTRGEIFYDQAANTLRIYNGSTVGGVSLAKSDLTNVSNSDFLTKANLAGVSGGGGNTTVSVSSSVPVAPSSGNLWLDTNTGILYVYFNDGTSSQWIQPVSPYPDTTSLATVSYVNSAVTGLASTSYVNTAVAGYATTGFVNSAVTGLASTAFVNSAVSAATFVLNVEADDSTLRSVTSGSPIRFTGSGGITTTSDSSGNITIIGGGTTGNITFAVTTIDSSDSSAIRFTPAVIFDSDVTVQNNLVIDNSVDVALNLSVNNQLTVKDILVTGTFLSQGSGIPELFSDSEIKLTAGTRVEITASPLKMASFTSGARDLLIAVNGDVIYNTTTNKLQVRAAGVWVDLH